MLVAPRLRFFLPGTSSTSSSHSSASSSSSGGFLACFGRHEKEGRKKNKVRKQWATPMTCLERLGVQGVAVATPVHRRKAAIAATFRICLMPSARTMWSFGPEKIDLTCQPRLFCPFLLFSVPCFLSFLSCYYFQSVLCSLFVLYRGLPARHWRGPC